MWVRGIRNSLKWNSINAQRNFRTRELARLVAYKIRLNLALPACRAAVLRAALRVHQLQACMPCAVSRTSSARSRLRVWPTYVKPIEAMYRSDSGHSSRPG